MASFGEGLFDEPASELFAELCGLLDVKLESVPELIRRRARALISSEIRLWRMHGMIAGEQTVRSRLLEGNRN